MGRVCFVRTVLTLGWSCHGPWLSQKRAVVPLAATLNGLGRLNLLRTNVTGLALALSLLQRALHVLPLCCRSKMADYDVEVVEDPPRDHVAFTVGFKGPAESGSDSDVLAFHTPTPSSPLPFHGPFRVHPAPWEPPPPTPSLWGFRHTVYRGLLTM